MRAKIRAQGKLLEELRGGDGGLIAHGRRACAPDDAGNLEAQAARGTWPLIFRDPKFRRGGEERRIKIGIWITGTPCSGPPWHRALCAAGLHPSIGVRHQNRYDAFCLAADVMEPFRPLIDRRVSQWIVGHDPAGPLTTATKSWMLVP